MLSNKQKVTINEPLHDFNILSGVTASGKTFIANLIFYRILLLAPYGALILLSGNTIESLYDNVIHPLLDMDKTDNALMWTTVANKRRIIVRHSDVQVICVGANTERAEASIQGKNLLTWYGDEITKQPKSFIDQAISRCRYVENNTMLITPKLWTCNPDDPVHYIKRSYIDNNALDVRNWYYEFKDNPTITQTFIDSQADRYSGVFYERMIKGVWTAAEGAIYHIDKSKHVVNTIPENQVIEYYLGVDWGYTDEHPMALLLIAETNHGYYISDEIYNTGLLIDDHLYDMMKTKGWFNLRVSYNSGITVEMMPTRIKAAYCDSARPDSMASLRKLTDIPCFKANKSKDDGIQTVMNMIRKDELYIHSRCVNTLREFDICVWGVKENDHALDAFRYFAHTHKTGRVNRITDFRTKRQ